MDRCVFGILRPHNSNTAVKGIKYSTITFFFHTSFAVLPPSEHHFTDSLFPLHHPPLPPLCGWCWLWLIMLMNGRAEGTPSAFHNLSSLAALYHNWAETQCRIGQVVINTLTCQTCTVGVFDRQLESLCWAARRHSIFITANVADESETI